VCPKGVDSPPLWTRTSRPSVNRLLGWGAFGAAGTCHSDRSVSRARPRHPPPIAELTHARRTNLAAGQRDRRVHPPFPDNEIGRSWQPLSTPLADRVEKEDQLRRSFAADCPPTNCAPPACPSNAASLEANPGRDQHPHPMRSSPSLQRGRRSAPGAVLVDEPGNSRVSRRLRLHSPSRIALTDPARTGTTVTRPDRLLQRRQESLCTPTSTTITVHGDPVRPTADPHQPTHELPSSSCPPAAQ